MPGKTLIILKPLQSTILASGGGCPYRQTEVVIIFVDNLKSTTAVALQLSHPDGLLRVTIGRKPKPKTYSHVTSKAESRHLRAITETCYLLPVTYEIPDLNLVHAIFAACKRPNR